MANQNFVDHSPHDAAPAPPLANASNLILIDNYDSFTWNVYQYLKVEGASVRVFRNDKITLKELVALEPTQLVISPGPGHPATDSGISNEAIRHFAGKIPILGVCMGQQCMISAFGGEVLFAGEILHGKTSPLGHDAKGLYAGLAQDLPVTRYHSLAGSQLSLPSCFEVSSWSFNGSSPSSKIIMGVRHKEFVIEGVQFHPESILTGGGRTMFKNFLGMSGGSWNQNNTMANGVQKQTAENGATTNNLSNVPKTNILESIFAHRRRLVSEQKLVPSQRPEDLKMLFEMDLAPPLVSFVDRLRKTPFSLSLMAEIKRASPSKGDISLSATAASQARTYALAGASVISVLTEPKWFKGSLDDMRAVRQALESMPNRPAILRKDFIFDEYQILEARLAGADTVLLIVKMLDRQTLQRLYAYSVSLGMEPLVEVNNEDEMKDALALNAKAIGVNNRNLTSFDVDLGTTSRLISMTPKDTILCALSGISKSDDVEAYKKNGVGAVLVGEALMKASNVNEFVYDLLGSTSTQHQLPKTQRSLSVKICGTRSLAAAKCAVGSGAKLIGLILVDGRKRRVPLEEARKISAFLQSVNQQHTEESSVEDSGQDHWAIDYFSSSASELFARRKKVLLVGVFQNQPLQFVLDQQKELNLDVVQLHGSEPLEWARLIPVPVIKAFKPGDPGISTRGYHALPLLDSASGGSGTKLDLKAVTVLLEKDQNLRIILAGGLKPDNVDSVLSELGHLRQRVVGVDVSSGVETDGAQDQKLIKSFIEAATGSHS